MKIETRGRKQKLTDDQKKEIIKSYLQMDKLAEMYGVNICLIRKVIKNRKAILAA